MKQKKRNKAANKKGRDRVQEIKLENIDDFRWLIPQTEGMRVSLPGRMAEARWRKRCLRATRIFPILSMSLPMQALQLRCEIKAPGAYNKDKIPSKCQRSLK